MVGAFLLCYRSNNGFTVEHMTGEHLDRTRKLLLMLSYVLSLSYVKVFIY
jgi:hypothetical protein